MSVRSVASVLVAALVSTLVVAGTGSSPAEAEPEPVAAVRTTGLTLGVHTGPGARGVSGAQAFATSTGSTIGRVLDFLPTSSWLEMTRIDWLLSPYRGTPYRLELSVPLLPDVSGVSLETCATGAYDTTWRSIATSLVTQGLAGTAVRPGWEMNGSWYRWSAAGRSAAYAGCFRSLVTAMRSVPGQHLSFVFNPNLGAGSMPAEQAYPGDAYVDEVSVDVYDTSWSWYPVPAGTTSTQAATNAWSWIKRGDHGLDFWTAFAATHGKPVGVSEWGLTWRSDGHGGGDDPAFVDRLFDWATDPANRVTYLTYFNSADGATLRHDVLSGSTTFPLGAARVRARSALVAPRATAARTPDVTPEPSPPAPAAAPSVPTPATPVSPVVLRALTRPSLTGPARPGSRVRVSAGRWTPSPTTVRFQWYRGSRAVPGARTASHRVVTADVGRRLRVRVTALRTGLSPTTTWSGLSRVVRR